MREPREKEEAEGREVRPAPPPMEEPPERDVRPAPKEMPPVGRVILPTVGLAGRAGVNGLCAAPPKGLTGGCGGLGAGPGLGPM